MSDVIYFVSMYLGRQLIFIGCKRNEAIGWVMKPKLYIRYLSLISWHLSACFFEFVYEVTMNLFQKNRDGMLRENIIVSGWSNLEQPSNLVVVAMFS